MLLNCTMQKEGVETNGHTVEKLCSREGQRIPSISSAVDDMEHELDEIFAISKRMKEQMRFLKRCSEDMVKSRDDHVVENVTSAVESRDVHSEECITSVEDQVLEAKSSESPLRQHEPRLPEPLAARWGVAAQAKRQSTSDSFSPTNVLVTKQEFHESDEAVDSPSRHASSHLSNFSSIGNLQQQKLKLYGSWEEVFHKAAMSGKPRYRDMSTTGVKQIMRKSVAAALDDFMPSTQGLRDAILHPNSNLHICKGFIGLSLILADVLILPLAIAWDMNVSIGYTVFVPIFWFADMVLNFLTGYYRRGKLVRDYRKVAQRYCLTWFLFDFSMLGLDVTVSTLILSQQVYDPGLSNVREVGLLARFLRLARILRVAKMSYYATILELRVNTLGWQFALFGVVMKTLLIFFLAVHVLGCGWFYIGRASAEAGLQSWLTSYTDTLREPLSGIDQYVVCFHWVLGQFTPAPNRIQPVNTPERVYNIFVVFFALVVVGSSISRITQTIQRAMQITAEASRCRAEVTYYLKTNEIRPELSLRILQFVDHTLGKRKDLFFDGSLISGRLMKELQMARRGPLLQDNAFFDLIRRAFPAVFIEVCEQLQLEVYESGDDIFTQATNSAGMYVVTKGQYVEIDHDRAFDLDLEEIAFFAEVSLFSAFLHTKTMRCKTFADIFTLGASHFVQSVKEHPGCGTYVYQYAKSLISTLTAAKSTPADLTEEIRMQSVAFTDCYQVLNLHPDKQVETFAVPGDRVKDPREQLERLFNMLSDTTQESSGCETVRAELERIFPEIRQGHGSLAQFSAPPQLCRATACMMSMLQLAANRYDDFTQDQPAANRLSEESWGLLQNHIDQSGIRSDTRLLHVVMVFLAIKSLGKSERLLLQLPPEFHGAESSVLFLLRTYPDIVPSVAKLSEDGKELLVSMLTVHRQFNLGSFVQAENSPVEVNSLQHLMLDTSTVKLSMVAALGLMCGIMGSTAWRSSKFLDEKTSQKILLSLQFLQHTDEYSCQAIYWSYIVMQARRLRLAAKTPSELAFARLACLCQLDGPSAELESLTWLWASLDNPDKNVLVNFLLADGIHESSTVFYYLPFCLSHAKNNRAVGLARMLRLLVELIELTRAWTHTSAAQDLQTIHQELVVNLSNLADFTELVKSSAVFESCLEHVDFKLHAGTLYLSMGVQNWSRIDDNSSLAVGIQSSIRLLCRKQQDLQKTLDMLQPNKFSL